MINRIRIALRFALGILFGLCAADGIHQLRGLTLLPALWENVAAAAFFLLAGAALALAWKQRDKNAIRRMCRWTAGVLGGSLILLLLIWLWLLLGLSAGLEWILYLLAVVSAPVTSCTVLFWPVFGWAVLLVVSIRLRRMLGAQK